MNGTIVCGIDESSGSRQAASIAARLARDLDANALLVRVTDAGGIADRLAPTRPGRARQARRRLRAVADEHCFPAGTRVRVKSGDPADTLIAVADREDAELIVVAAVGQSSVGSVLLGHVTSTLMRQAPCPVVVVPPDAVAPLDARGMTPVVCGVAGEETDLALLRLADDLANRLGGELYAVHAYDPAAPQAARGTVPGADPHEFAEHMLGSALEQADVEAEGRTIAGPVHESLEGAAEQLHAGLIVVGSTGPGKLGSTLHGSVPTYLVSQGRTAVVVVPLGTRPEPGSGHYELIVGAA